jgi:LAO/AO transport system kinase
LKRDEGLARRLIEGDRTAVARLITWAENADPRFRRELAGFWSRVGNAWRVGVTGPPGAGKSTLTNELTLAHRAAERTVGILAVDPSSPFTGGALLGDRIRMEERTADPGVFIRSMASRGSHGGLARAAVDACDVMDAFGFDELILETVGVGQAEYDVVAAADTVLVVLCPGAGDGIQAMKSGLLEVADVLVVNKSDVSGADRLAMDLEEAVHVRRLRRESEGEEWTTPVVRASAGRREGVADVLAAVERHREFLRGGHLEAHRRRMRLGQVRRVLGQGLDETVWERLGYGARVEALLAEGGTPYDIAADVLAEIAARLTGAEDPTPGARRS